MQIENLTLVGGLTMTTGDTPVQSNLRVQLRPESYPGTGNVWYDTQNNVDGIIKNNPIYSNVGFLFNRTLYQSIELANSPGNTTFNSSNNYTIEMWIRPQDPEIFNQSMNVITTKPWLANPKGRPYTFSISGSQIVNCSAMDSIGQGEGSEFSINYDTWYQVVAVYNWSQSKIFGYKNGIASGTVGEISVPPLNNTNISSTYPTIMGLEAGQSGIDTHNYQGYIGILRIYDKALSASEVEQNFNADRGIFGI